MSSDKVLQLKLTEHLLDLLQGEYATLNEVQLYEVFTRTLQLRRLEGHEPLGQLSSRSARLQAPPQLLEEPDASSLDEHQLQTRPSPREAPPSDPEALVPNTRNVYEPPPEQPNSRQAAPQPHATWEEIAAQLQARTPIQQWKQQEGEHPLRALLQSAAAPGDNILLISAGSLSCVALFQTGSLVEVHPRHNDQDISLLNLLVEKRRISPEQRQQAHVYMDRYQVDEDEALLQGHLLSYPQVLRALQERLTLWVQRLMLLEEARFALYSMARLPRRYSTPPVSLARIAYQEMRQQLDQLPPEVLRQQSAEHLHHYLLSASPLFSVHELQLSPQEAQLHQRLCENIYTFEELLQHSDLPQPTLHATLQTFMRLELARAQPERSLQMFRGELRQQTLFLAGADHFEALGVHWSAPTEEIEEAWRRLQRKWSLQRLPADADQTLREELHQMLGRLEASHKLLGDTQQRRAYRKKLIAPDQLKDAIQLYYRQGDAALLRKHYDEAESCMLHVLELDPRHGGARVKLKLARDRRRRS